MSHNIFLSIVIPAFNEEKRLPSTLEATIEYLNKQQYSSEIIVVSDGSFDKTKESAEYFQETFSELKVIEYFPNKGKGTAVKIGMLEAVGQLRLFMDADLAVPLSCLSSFVKATENGSNIAIGSRALDKSVVINGQNFFRMSLGKIYGMLLRLTTGLKFKDTQCGFKLFTGVSAEKVFSQANIPHQLFDAEILLLAKEMKISVKEIPIKWRHDEESRLTYGFIGSLWVLKELWGLKKMVKRK